MNVNPPRKDKISTIEAVLTDSKGNAIARTRKQLKPNTDMPQVIELDFDGESIYKHNTNEPYLLGQISIFYIDDLVINLHTPNELLYQTSPYRFTEFNTKLFRKHGKLKITKIYGEDKDGDDLFDYIVIEAYVNISKDPMNYEIKAELSPYGLDNKILSSTSLCEYIDSPKIVKLKLPVSDLHIPCKKDKDEYLLSPYFSFDSYYINLYLVNEEDKIVNEIIGYLTEPRLPPPPIRITGITSHYGVDLDNNGRLNYLLVNLGLEVQENDACRIEAILCDKSGRIIDKVEDPMSRTRFFVPEDPFLEVMFQGEKIYKSQTDSPYYIKNLILTCGKDIDLMCSIEKLGPISGYNFDSFDKTPTRLISFTGEYSDC